MTIGVGKTNNEYARALDGIDASKTVWMAIAFSLAMRATDDNHDAARQLCADEWRTLHDNGIVPQRPRLLK